MPRALCEHVRTGNIRLSHGGDNEGTTISIWPAECHSHPFDRYTADRQPTSAGVITKVRQRGDEG